MMMMLRATTCTLMAFLASLSWTVASHAMTYSKGASADANENAILATGPITPDDAFRFQVYLSKLEPKPRTSLHLDSTGGSVQGAIAVGRIVHEIGIRTFVTGADAKCNSACTNIFLAGRDRESGKSYRVKGSNNRLGFHNFIPVLKDKTFTDKDALNVIARGQKTIYELATYFEEIDADLELLGMGLKQKDLYAIPNDEALRHGIHVLDADTKEIIFSETYQRYIKR